MVYLLSLTDIQQRRAELLCEAEAIAELLKADEARPADDPQKLNEEQIDEYNNQFHGLVQQHADMQPQEDNAKYVAEATKKNLATRSTPGEPVLEVTDGSPKKRIPAKVRRCITKNFKGTLEGVDSQERAYRFGQWALARLTTDLPNKYGFHSAVKWCKNELGVVMGAAMGEGGGDVSGAGVFVPDEFTTDIIRLRETFGVADRVLRTTQMLSETKTIPRWRTQMTVFWRGENLTGTESNPEYDDIMLTARSLTGISRMSRELDADSAISLGDELAGEAAYAFAEKEDQAAFNGDGTSTYGGQQGIRPALGALTAGTAPGFILGAGNAWSELTLANFRAVIGGSPQYADTPNTTWICHKTFFYDVILGLIQATGGGVEAREIVDPGQRSRTLFLGYPVTFSQVYPSTEANSQVCCTFGDHSQGAVIGRRSGIEVSFSEQAYVNSQSLWERNQIGIRTIERLHVNVHDVGSDTVAGPIGGLQTAAS